MPDLFHRDGNQLKVMMDSQYDAGITAEVDRQIRHMPQVMKRMLESAARLKNSTGSSNFELIISANPRQQRPRVYVVPKNNKGIHEELADAVLLKAALGMSNK